MPRSKHLQDDEKPHDRVIEIREDGIFNFSDVIDKIAGRKQPKITQLLRGKGLEPGVYKIRDGRTKKLTGEKLEILTWEKVLWIQLKNEQAQAILGTEKPPLFGTYLHDLRRYFGRHEMAYFNRPIMYLHNIRYIPRPVQHNLDGMEQ